MKVDDIIRKNYGDDRHHDYRVYGGNPWGLCDVYREIITSGKKEVEVEVWRTMQKKGYSIRFAYKVNGKPCNIKWLSDYVFNAPEDCRKILSKFTVDLSQVPTECKRLHNKPSEGLEEGVNLFYLD